jgi:hypothetical protein
MLMLNYTILVVTALKVFVNKNPKDFPRFPYWNWWK